MVEFQTAATQMNERNLFLLNPLKTWIASALLLINLFATVVQAADVRKSNGVDARSIYLVFLMDASGSMKKTDPTEIRKLASQVVVSLLSPEDRVAVVEFDEEGRLLSDWRSAGERAVVFNAIDRVGNRGYFTDFRAGFEATQNLFVKAPENARKIVLLLSDGKFEPNLRCDRYAPYNLQYRLALSGSGKGEKAAIDENFRNQVTPVAKRIIDSELLPYFKNTGAEIFSVALSPAADKEFLKYLADQTSQTKTESHFFFANQAVDLMETFLGVIHAWRNKVKIQAESGNLASGIHNQVYVDDMVRDVNFILLTDNQADLQVTAAKQPGSAIAVTGTHANLKIMQLPSQVAAGKWDYTIGRAAGKYKLLVAGQSSVDIVVSGLKEKYHYGEPVKALVALQRKGEDSRSLFSPRSTVTAVISTEAGIEETYPLRNTEEGFEFSATPTENGEKKLVFTLQPFDRQDKEMLPRKSSDFRIVVLPRLFAEPDFLNFGQVEVGKNKTLPLRIVSGLLQPARITITGEVLKASREPNNPQKWPSIDKIELTLNPGQALEQGISLTSPPKGSWGDFEGELVVREDSGQQFLVGYRVHVPSIWERFTSAVQLLLLFLAIILAMFSIYWGALKTPRGTLKSIISPPGNIVNDIKLSKVKRGVLNRWFHWRKNTVLIARTRGDIMLPFIPVGMEILLTFNRFGGDYIRNASSDKSGLVFTVIPNEGDRIDRTLRPGASYGLKHGLRVKVEGYEFDYQNL